ncbi:hypothetical protein BU26DRAFT_351646 [Trematosphaeria pertusa]|uniref:Uncharacterized protein n=1 Tax=Trematosphaeria pertusa TaxID=390896 RepID=A0A6A6ICP1_9PLEO|nr:uncharacterized protein BU26DRAFT_351646 [Trematosphaeria pertusa]KAF2247672.1 hypothetical protein BU26DRAFT_351646 [Trematosphaeria pertusa]
MTTGDEPVLGLWRTDLLRHLLWSVREKPKWVDETDSLSKDEAGRETLAPSWSWFSFPFSMGSISNEHVIMDSKKNMHSIAAVLGIDITWEGQEYVSSLRYGEILIRGQVSEMANGVDPFYADIHLDLGQVKDKTYLLPAVLSWTPSWSKRPKWVESVFGWHPFKKSKAFVECLVLEETSRRIGTARARVRCRGKKMRFGEKKSVILV